MFNSYLTRSNKFGKCVPFIHQIMRPACVILECGGMRVDAKVLIKASMNLAEMNGPSCNAAPIPTKCVSTLLQSWLMQGKKLFLRKCLITLKGYSKPRL